MSQQVRRRLIAEVLAAAAFFVRSQKLKPAIGRPTGLQPDLVEATTGKERWLQHKMNSVTTTISGETDRLLTGAPMKTQEHPQTQGWDVVQRSSQSVELVAIYVLMLVYSGRTAGCMVDSGFGVTHVVPTLREHGDGALMNPRATRALFGVSLSLGSHTMTCVAAPTPQTPTN